MGVLPTRARDRRGAAAVETALCICFIVLPLTFATMAYAYMFSFRQSVSQATTEGVRAAAVAPADTVSATQQSTNLAAVVGAINAALTNGVSCSLPASPNASGAYVGSLLRSGSVVGSCSLSVPVTCSTCKQVALDYDYGAHPLLPLPLLGFALPDHLSYSATAEVNQ